MGESGQYFKILFYLNVLLTFVDSRKRAYVRILLNETQKQSGGRIVVIMINIQKSNFTNYLSWRKQSHYTGYHKISSHIELTKLKVKAQNNLVSQSDSFVSKQTISISIIINFWLFQ